jgi:hypothetical protein
VRRLAEVVQAELELLETFGPYDAAAPGSGPSHGVQFPAPNLS